MPRIPVRTEPYDTIPLQTRHYKNKRDMVLRLLGKAAHINGAQFVVAWVNPRGQVDTYASDMLQDAVGRVLNMDEFNLEAARIGQEQERRRNELRLLEEKGKDVPAKRAAPEQDDDDDEFVDVDEDELDLAQVEEDDDLVAHLLGPSTPPVDAVSPAKTGTVFHTLQMPVAQLEAYYASRFSSIQQDTCKLVVKAWIKVIEPKKQVHFPYNKGEAGKPLWWPEGVRHREPDHLGKIERVALLTTIIRSRLVKVSDLELATAAAAAFISAPRLAILRELYQVAREEAQRRQSNVETGVVDTSDIVVQLPGAQSPADASKKRARQEPQALFTSANENVGCFAAHSQKRAKHVAAPSAVHFYAPCPTEQAYVPPFTYAPQWREQTMLSVSPYVSPVEAPTAQMAQQPEISPWPSRAPSRAPSVSHRRDEHDLGVPLERSHSYGQHLHAPRPASPTHSLPVHSPQPQYASSAGIYQQAQYQHQAQGQFPLGYPQQGVDYGQSFVQDAYHVPHQQTDWGQAPAEPS